MVKSFLCPKCSSQNIKVLLSDGTILESLGSKLKLASKEKTSNNRSMIEFKGAITQCLECRFEFYPKCLVQDDVVWSET